MSAETLLSQEKELFGYIIGDVQIDIDSRRLIRLNAPRQREKSVQVMTLRITMMRLLEYLLTHGQNRIILNDEILSHVWDKNKLASSSQRLWQVMKELKRKLSLLGITDNLITRVDNSGYYIDFRIVKKLYCNVLPGD